MKLGNPTYKHLDRCIQKIKFDQADSIFPFDDLVKIDVWGTIRRDVERSIDSLTQNLKLWQL